ncbi:hypothetical protein Pmar_PMAR017062 [Perkinsus marinus ATCC 50983]|uniref:Uncharacterized protein n=1 Tax=Perkinsus marinus (strain ATCC 50983 / TXsc) TaxID=423536 RepID=C5LSG3_PERM5|nr:hypothetical protein Pmar_PMAR017062 [Perkinsus marinus ATCC 50983]EER00204.1 hypothetical protein Pmar_PMAR017062 [Perkinsus marinus ATCC 50983]|eukprot:XP_002767486.1 hypothetical protein Pmar_PMAR017062 [Perkinsus marinus ATCC 50983]
MTEEYTIAGDLTGLSEAELAAVQELLERTAEEAADDESSLCCSDHGRTPLIYQPSLTRRRHTLPDCSQVALPMTGTRRPPPKIADRIFANAMISLNAQHRALWRQADRELENTPPEKVKTGSPNRRFSMPNVPLRGGRPDAAVIPLIPSGIVSSLGLDSLDDDSVNTKQAVTSRKCGLVSTSESSTQGFKFSSLDDSLGPSIWKPNVGDGDDVQ